MATEVNTTNPTSSEYKPQTNPLPIGTYALQVANDELSPAICAGDYVVTSSDAVPALGDFVVLYNHIGVPSVWQMEYSLPPEGLMNPGPGSEVDGCYMVRSNSMPEGKAKAIRSSLVAGAHGVIDVIRAANAELNGEALRIGGAS